MIKELKVTFCVLVVLFLADMVLAVKCVNIFPHIYTL